MRFIRFDLSDKTPVKFKIRRLYPYGLDIEWKYTNRINLSKYINLNIMECYMYRWIEIIEQMTDEEIINKYKELIEERHEKIKNTKRKI